MLGRNYKSGVSQNQLYPYTGYISLQNSYYVNISGLGSEWAFQNTGDGVYIRAAADHTTIRWKGQVVTYEQSGGGGGGGGGGSGTPVYHDAEMAITIYSSGEVRIAFGDCASDLPISGPRFYAYGGTSNTLNLYYTNPGSEMADGAQDVFFKSTLPPGLTFTASGTYAGRLSGTPTHAGTYPFTISGKNGTNPVSKDYEITITGVTPLDVELADGSVFPVGAKQFEAYNYKLGATGGTGAYTWTATSSLPKGLYLASDGTLSGVPTGPAGSTVLWFRVDSGSQFKLVAYTLNIAEGSNEAPALVSSLPAEDSVVAYVGVPKDFSVVCSDADGDPITYVWKAAIWNNTETEVGSAASISYAPADTLIEKLRCYASDGLHESVLVREWNLKVKAQPLAFTTDAPIVVSTGAWIGGSATGVQLALNDEDTAITSVTLASGEFPAGVGFHYSAKHYIYFTGSPRQPGNYQFTLAVTLEDGDAAELPVTIEVQGDAIGAATWYIDPAFGDAGNSGLIKNEALKYVFQIGERLLAGDTVVFIAGDQPYAFEPVEGVNYVASEGPVRFADGSGDTSVIQLQNGGSIAFVVGRIPGEWLYDEPINVVRVPDGAKASDYTIHTVTASYILHGLPYIEDGWLKVKPLWFIDDHQRIVMRFAENGNKEYTFKDATIANAAMFYNEGGENATVQFEGSSECSWKFCTFLWATNGVDLVLKPDSTLWCHEQEKIEGFDTMTFNGGTTLKIDNLPPEITVRGGVTPIFAANPGAYTIELTRALNPGAYRALIWDYEDYFTNEFNLKVAAGENLSDYQFQKFGNHLFVVKRNSDGTFTNLEEACPAAVISTRTPAAAGASVSHPLTLTVGTPFTFNIESTYQHAPGFTWIRSVRYELDNKVIDGDFYEGCTITPTDDMVLSGTHQVVHHLHATLSDFYHEVADTADWYFKVVPTPPEVAPLGRITAWDGAQFQRDFKEFVSGGWGALTFAFAEGKSYEGLSITQEGVLTGTMTTALDDEDLAIVVTDEWGSAVPFTQNLHLRTKENEPPYLLTVSHTEDALDFYIGDYIRFIATVKDDENDTMYCQFVLDGEVVKSVVVHSYDDKTIYYDFFDYNPGHETDVSTLILQMRNDTSDPWETVKGWTITKLERPTYAEGRDLGEIAVGTQFFTYPNDNHIPLECITEYGEHIVDAEVVRGELPDGLELEPTTSGCYIRGEARKLGRKMFSILYTSSNGQRALATYELTVVGEADTEPRTWTVCSWDWWQKNNPHDGSVQREDFDYESSQPGLLGLASGDIVNVIGDSVSGIADSGLDMLQDRRNHLGKEGATFIFASGDIKIERPPKRVLDLSRVGILHEVNSLEITVPDEDLLFGETYGETVEVVKMSQGYYDYLHTTIKSGYFFEGDPWWNDEGVLCVKILGYSPYEHGYRINFADDIEKRDAIVEDKDFGAEGRLEIANAGVLPSSITFKGDVRLMYVLRDEHNYDKYPNSDTKLVFDKTLNLHITGPESPCVSAVYGPIEIERGARIHVSQELAQAGKATPVISSVNSITFTGDEDEKVTIVLPCALPEHSRLVVFDRYFDDSDPADSMQVELPSWVENKDAYHFVTAGGYNEGQYLYLQNYEDEATEEHGETTWDESSDLGSVERGETLKHDFAPSTLGQEGYYSTFTLIGKPYEISRGEGCSFDGTIGTAELQHVPFVMEATSGTTKDIADFGFAFPIEDTYCLWAHIFPNGKIRFEANGKIKELVVMDYQSDPTTSTSVLNTLTESYNHVYIARGEGTFTVRWDQFAMVTLHQDGRIVVAYGPLADAGRKAGDPDGQTYFYNVSDGLYNNPRMVVFSLNSGLYAGKDDLVLTPTEYVSSVTIGSSSGKLEHTAKRPGRYGAKVRYTASNQTTEDSCTWTRDFFWEVTGSEPRLPVITNFTAKIGTEILEPEDDGIIHVYEGQGMPTFTVEATEGCGSMGIRCYNSTGNSDTDIRVLNFKPDSEDIERIMKYGGEIAASNCGVYSILAYATVNNITAYRQLLFVRNKTFHIDCTTTDAANVQDGSADHPWQDFPRVITSGVMNGNSIAPRFVRGDKIIYHPGTYHNPIWLDNCVGGIEITSVEGHSAADTEILPEVYSKDEWGRRYGRRAFYEWTYALQELTNGWKYVHAPTQKTIVTGLAIRNSVISGDASIAIDTANYDNDLDTGLSLYGVAGGGAFGGVFVNCVFEDCVATNGYPREQAGFTYYDFPSYGGAVYGSTLVNCLLVGNHADIGGAASNCTLFNCTVADNTAAVAAGGVDGQCLAYNSLIRYNTCNGEESEYANTYRLSRLVPDVPELHDCFTAGDPLLCADYTLFPGSPCIGAGNAANYLRFSEVDLLGNPRFTDENTISIGAFEGEGSRKVTLAVETVGYGTVTPAECAVVVGGSQTFTAESERDVVGWYTNGVLAASSVKSFTWENIPVTCSLKVVFGAKTLWVGEEETDDAADIDQAIGWAGSGDTIMVRAGAYGPIDLSNFKGALTICAASYEAAKDDPDTWGAVGDVIIDGSGTSRCITARVDDDSLVFCGLTLTNGYVETGTAKDIEAGDAPGGGGGIRGGKAVRCTITDCRAYLKGGGAYGATLERCLVTGNTVFKKSADSNKVETYGGGAYGGILEDCRVTGNSNITWFLNGGGTYNSVVKNSFVWNNEAPGASASNVMDGEYGASVYVVEKVPTPQRVAGQPTQLQAPGEPGPVYEYTDKQSALSAAAKTGIDISADIVASKINTQDYVNLFKIETEWNWERNGWVNTIQLKDAEVEIVKDQIDDAFLTDTGNMAELVTLQKMDKTLTYTTPGLYYALEFAPNLSSGSFYGERHLSTGGSMNLSGVSLNTPSGFWRIAVHLTPDGE